MRAVGAPAPEVRGLVVVESLALESPCGPEPLRPQVPPLLQASDNRLCRRQRPAWGPQALEKGLHPFSVHGR